MIYARSLDAMNAICSDLGGSGGHSRWIHALNEWCSLVGVPAGHAQPLAAYNAIASKTGGATNYTRRIAAINDISGDMGGPTDAMSSLAGLTNIAAEAGGGLAELAFADFVNGVYRLNGATTTVDDIVDQDADEWGEFDPATGVVPGTGLTGNPIIAPALTATFLPTGVTMVFEFMVDAVGGGSLTFDFFNAPDWTFDWYGGDSVDTTQYLYTANGTDERSSYNASTPNTVEAALSTGPHKLALTLSPSHLAVSVNGETVAAVTDPGGPLALIFNEIGVNVAVLCALRTLTFHPPQADAALPGLSGG